MHLRATLSGLGGGLLLQDLSAFDQRTLLASTMYELTEYYISPRAGFYQSFIVIEITLHNFHMGIILLQLGSRRFLTNKRCNGKLGVGFGDGIEEIAANIASSTGPEIYNVNRSWT